MNKLYSRIDWENYPSSATPINEDNLNKMDAAIDEIDTRVVTMDTTKLSVVTANSMVKDVAFDETTGVFTITKLNGSVVTINTALEKIATNFVYDKTTQKLILTLIDGTIQEVDLTALLTQYEFLDSDTIAFTIGSDGKVSASVKNGSITGDKLEPNYLADVTLQANNAKNSADNAKESELLAFQYAEDARQSASETQKNDAANIIYSNTTSGLTSDNVQSAIDELAKGGIGNNSILLTLAECLASSLDTDIVGAKVMTEINNALKGKVNYVVLNDENVDSVFNNHIGMGIVDNYLYITISYSWIVFQLRIKGVEQNYRVFGIDKVITTECSENLILFECDVTSTDSVKNVFNKIKEKTNSLFAIVHTSGIYDLDSLIEIDEDRFNKIFQVNLFGAYRINKEFFSLLQKDSRIVITTSELAPLNPLPFTGLYGITKTALEKYAFSLRMELQLLGIKVVVIRPCAVKTSLLSASTQALDKFIENTKNYSCNAIRFKKIVNSVEAKNILTEKICTKQRRQRIYRKNIIQTMEKIL